jgi:hypothetical protein
MIDPKLALSIFTDFAATGNLRAHKIDNSSIDGQIILAIYFMIDEPPTDTTGTASTNERSLSLYP